MIQKMKAVTTLATLLTVLLVGAILTTSRPVQAGCCSAKKESTSCDKSKSCDKKKSCDKDKSCNKSESSGEKKGCGKVEK